MDLIFAVGLVGSFIVVAGAAWPESPSNVRPWKSLKNWLFAVGGVVMFVYALLGYLRGGPIFFVLLECMILVASALMMLDTDDRLDTIVISVAGLGLILASLYLFEGYKTLFFVLGLACVGLGYAFQGGTLRRDLSLTLGSALIALFSYLEASWIFFWLNVFFALFSGWYLVRHLGSLEGAARTSIPERRELAKGEG